MNLSKINFIKNFNGSINIDKTTVSFAESARHFNQCTWRDSKANPCYCEKAKLKFEAHLPDRSYLTRFSVRCPSCCGEDDSATHLYCAYCDEVLTGTIAGPGGKVSDHLITIRHIYRQALVLKENLESGDHSTKILAQARFYVSKFEEWSKQIRYPARISTKQHHLEAVLKDLHILLNRFRTVSPVCFRRTPNYFPSAFREQFSSVMQAPTFLSPPFSVPCCFCLTVQSSHRCCIGPN